MTDQLTEELVPSVVVTSIEFHDRMVVVNFTEADELRQQIQDHTSRVIPAGADPDVDAKVHEIMDDVQDLLHLAYVAKRNPPQTRPARVR